MIFKNFLKNSSHALTLLTGWTTGKKYTSIIPKDCCPKNN